MKIAVLGAGAWGTALAIHLAHRHPVVLWARNPENRARQRAWEKHGLGPRVPGR